MVVLIVIVQVTGEIYVITNYIYLIQMKQFKLTILSLHYSIMSPTSYKEDNSVIYMK